MHTSHVMQFNVIAWFTKRKLGYASFVVVQRMLQI